LENLNDKNGKNMAKSNKCNKLKLANKLF